MDTEYNATIFQIDTFGIDANRYGDLEPTSFDQGLWNGETWSTAAVDSNDMTLSPKFDPIAHSHTLPVISIDLPFSFESGPLFDHSPTSFAEPSFHGGIQVLHRDGSWDGFSQQSDGYCSMPPSLQSDGNWDASSHLSDGNHGMLRSLSFGGSSNTQLMDGLHEPMTTPTMTLQAHSLPTRFEDGLYDPSRKSESVSSESLSEIQTEAGTDPSNSFQLTFYKVTHQENTGAMVASATAEGKKPRGRHGPLNKQQREQAARMRKAGSCDTCRRRKAKVSNPLMKDNHLLSG
jgi:hypothetical protein